MGREKKVLGILALIFIAAFLFIIYRIYTIQILRHEQLDRYSAYSQTVKKIKSKRGTIYDRNGDVLAISQPKADIAVDPLGIKEKSAAAEFLAEVLGGKRGRIEKILKRKGHFYYISKDVSIKIIQKFKDRKRALRKKIKEMRKLGEEKDAPRKKLIQLLSDLHFVIILDGYKRVYPKGKMFANILGFVRKTDGIGLEGLEMSYNSYLSGKDREVKRFYIPGKGEGSIEVDKELKSSVGNDLHTTIDSRIQFIAEEELDKMMKKVKGKWGTVVIMDPATGHILAMANNPSFNPEKYYKYKPKSRRNYSVANLFEPGSTMKVFSILAVMNENLIKKDEIFAGHNGRFRYGRRWVRDHKKLKWMTLDDIVVYSSNIGTLLLADRLHSEKLYNYLENYGFGRKTGVHLPGESYNRIRHWKKWYPIDKANISFGQGLSVNSVHMVKALAAVLNGGFLWEPVIVEKVVDPDTKATVFEHDSKPDKIEFSSKVTKKMIKMMTNVVDEGTAKQAKIKGISVLGKTGTSQKFDFAKKKYSWNKVVTSFLGAVPADDPKLVISVVVDQPEGREFGGTVGAPVFRNIAKRVLPLMGIYLEKDNEKDIIQVPVEEVMEIPELFENEGDVKDVSPLEMVEVPNLQGLQIRKAIHVASKAGLNIVVAGKGTYKIKSHYPEKGEFVPFGTVITLETEEKAE